VDAWQAYSYDKRSSSSPYLDGTEVGYFDGKRTDVVKYDDPSEACADFSAVRPLGYCARSGSDVL